MTQIPLERKVLNENDRVAAELRARFAANEILCLNLVSSPGRGKRACWSAPWKPLLPRSEWPYSPATFKRTTTRFVSPVLDFRPGKSPRGEPAISMLA